MLEEKASEAAGKSNTARNVVLGVAAVYVLVSIFLLFDLRGRVVGLEQKQQTLEASNKQLQDRLQLTNKSVSESVQALGSKVGMTQAEIDKRTAELKQQQQQLTAAQKKTQQQVSQVTGEVTGVAASAALTQCRPCTRVSPAWNSSSSSVRRGSEVTSAVFTGVPGRSRILFFLSSVCPPDSAGAISRVV